MTISGGLVRIGDRFFRLRDIDAIDVNKSAKLVVMMCDGKSVVLKAGFDSTKERFRRLGIRIHGQF